MHMAIQKTIFLNRLTAKAQFLHRYMQTTTKISVQADRIQHQKTNNSHLLVGDEGQKKHKTNVT